jgi:outer membrane protein
MKLLIASILALSALALPALAEAPILDLASALEIAKQHAPELRQAAATSEAARARVDEARAPLLPQVTGTASYSRGTYNSAFNTGLVAAPRSDWSTRNSFDANLRATQLIYDFGQTWELKEAAKKNAAATEQTEQATQLTISYNVRSAFLTAGANKALAVVAQATLSNQERHLGQIQGFVDVGTRPPIDLAQARTDVANAKLALLRAQINYSLAKATLSRAMGVSDDHDYDVSDELPTAEPDEEAALGNLLEVAEKNRPEFAAVHLQLLAQHATISSIKGQYGPSLGAVGTLDEGGYELNHMVPNVTGGISLTWPIFQGGITNGRVDENRAILTEIDAQLQTLRADTQLSVTQAVRAIKSAQAEVIAADELVSFAKERVTLAEGRYTTGVGNTIELGDAELALNDAQTQRVSAQYDLASARALLRKSLGRR